MEVIRTENLTKRFPIGLGLKSIIALNNLNLTLYKGETFGFLGPNGAGKTTTIKLLLGLIFPTSGRGFIFGRPIGNNAAKEKIGFLPENPAFYEYLTSGEYMNLSAQLLGIPHRERNKKIEYLLGTVGISKFKDMQLRKFSKGMLQRLGIAQALINDPELIILDEPMSGLDPIGRKEVRNIILHLKDEGRTIFFSTHILADVELICDRVGILQKGQLVLEKRLDEILEFHLNSFEIVISGLDEKIVEEIKKYGESVLVKDNKLFITTLAGENKEKILSIIFKNGGNLLSMIPQRESLEDFLVKDIWQKEEL
ncbi:MAG: ABC transporter ATP-binding protein [Thermodesulfobacteriota bacterium]|nr:ABC transporter ATP-binding protein [Thermodesulfobacteriota bacterium]